MKNLVILLLAAPALMAQRTDECFRAIRANDLKAVKALCAAGTLELRDRLDWTPLHYAAVYGSVDSLRIILEAGGDPNARNKSRITPVMFGAYSLEKTRLLVANGGDVNAKSKDGGTPLWVAAGVPGNGPTVRYLIEKGADLKETRPNGSDYLIRAAASVESPAIRTLLERGLDPHRVDKSGATALLEAVNCDGGAKARLLVEAGSDVNVSTTYAGRVKNGPIDSFGLTPLMLAASCGETDLVAALLKKGANVDAVDHRHMTALIMAVAVDHANPDTVKLLMDAGADLNIGDRNNETAMDWARKYRNPAMVALLEKAGAKGKGLAEAPRRPADYKPSAREAIDRASALLVKSNEAFFREGGGCAGCHHQPFAARAFGAVKAAGLPADSRLRRSLTESMVAERARLGESPLLMTVGGGGYATFLYPLAGMADMGEQPTPFTDFLTHYIAESQDVHGAWSAPGDRPPLQESAITQTMLAIYALKNFGWEGRRAEFDGRIARGRDWLTTASACTTVEEADRLMGLWIADAPKHELRKIADRLLSLQRADGGWAQTPYLESDAFGTGAALYTLRKTGYLRASDEAYRKGARYLLDTQFPDGSWYVRSRAVKLQPYFQSDFPYDHDQWISNPATAYAVMALAPVAAR